MRLSNYCIIKISQNTEESPGDLGKLFVIQIPMKDSANAGVKNSHGVTIIQICGEKVK